MMHVIYHHPCRDGFAARWAAWKALGEDGVRYVPADYNDPIPEIEHPEEADVVMVDVSWPRGDLLKLRDRVRDLVVLDHHHTAREALQGLDFARFDMDKSGARLAWEFFHGERPVPDLIRHVEDQDLWRFDLPGTRRVAAYLDTLAWDIEWWDRLAQLLEDGPGRTRVLEAGEAVLGRDRRLREAVIEQSHLIWLDRPYDAHGRWKEPEDGPYAAVNLGIKSLVSRTLHDLLARTAGDIAIAYGRTASGQWNFSLRSRRGTDCSEIAKRYGGGGHKQAAGFTLDYPPIVRRDA